ncbi:MAG: metallophosphoesterase [Clostridia bacterium]|nr:metallophosphoesterase [Clostridia bacterium]
MKPTHYRLTSPKPDISFKAAIVADLHDRPYDTILPILERERPDMILIPGDLSEALDRPASQVSRSGLGLLAECTAIAPTFYSLGNHEIGGCHGRIYKAKMAGKGELPPFVMRDEWREAIEKSGATLLDESFIRWNGFIIGGLGSGLLNPGWVPDLSWLEAYAKTAGYKLLLCHHPEYFDRYLRPFDIDLVISGHAHGGQWRIFGRGVYAPDQHLFPKYTSGVHEDRLVISRGVANTFPLIPRFFNRREVVFVTVNE